jgi:tRNA-dihydrouridine synthase
MRSAPMDGYSDWPFRSLCRTPGSAMSIANRGAGVGMMLKKEAV